jgi:transposase
MEIHVIGIDLGKTVFYVVGVNQRGEVVLRKKFSRPQLLRFTSNLQVHLIGMEACGGAHFLGRALRAQGHEVRLMPAQYVRLTDSLKARQHCNKRFTDQGYWGADLAPAKRTP